MPTGLFRRYGGGKSNLAESRKRDMPFSKLRLALALKAKVGAFTPLRRVVIKGLDGP